MIYPSCFLVVVPPIIYSTSIILPFHFSLILSRPYILSLPSECPSLLVSSLPLIGISNIILCCPLDTTAILIVVIVVIIIIFYSFFSSSLLYSLSPLLVKCLPLPQYLEYERRFLTMISCLLLMSFSHLWLSLLS